MHSELIVQINQYLNGSTSIKDLQSCLLRNLQAILDSRDQRDISVADALDVALIRLSDGLIEEREVWEQLAAIVRKHETETPNVFQQPAPHWAVTEVNSSTSYAKISEPHTIHATFTPA